MTFWVGGAVLLPPAEEADAPRLVMEETSNKDY